MLIKRLLIANRGEIACRIIKTAKAQHIETIALYTPIDAQALHVHLADEAYALTGESLAETYLSIEAVINAAKETHADAIHPGYGFLSENPAFAQACQDAGIIFIGPPAGAMKQMALKHEAKQLMAKAGVPTLPGYDGPEQSDSALSKAAYEIGLPLLIKASAGGGGRGMRIVTDMNQLSAQIASARQEAQSSFGEGRLILERYFPEARHIESQIFADTHGQVVHLFERDCSLQRRHQKIVEEAPGLLSKALRKSIQKAAIKATKALDYVGAGTIEFLVTPDDHCYFMEMNTRLQVEHPVTEAITGLDLVHWQLLIAEGAPLPCTQNQIVATGAAIEVRVYAEDPAHHFLPATGTIAHLEIPEEDCRVDTGVQSGNVIGIHYDPLLFKLITHGESREAACKAMQHALSHTDVAGLKTNLPFLRQLLSAPNILSGDYHTQSVEGQLADFLAPPAYDQRLVLTAAALYRVLSRAQAPETSEEPNSPWHQSNAWRLNTPAQEHFSLTLDNESYRLVIDHQDEGYQLHYEDALWQASGSLSGNSLQFTLDNQQWKASLTHLGHCVHLFIAGMPHTLIYPEQHAHSTEEAAGGTGLSAPMPGLVTQVLVSPGASVAPGDKLMVIEAMKMEHTIVASETGTIESIHYPQGAQVEEGATLFSFKAYE